MAGFDILEAYKNSAFELQHLFEGNGQKWLRHTMVGQDFTEKKQISPDRLFELLCYFTFVQELDLRVSDLHLVPAPGNHGFRFPYGPANKENFAFFRFSYGNATYDLCCGTGVFADSDEPKEHPDISLQRMVGGVTKKDRYPGLPLALWDAKYHNSGALGKPDVAQMAVWADIFDLQPVTDGDLLEQLFPPAFSVSSVITNGTSLAYNRSLLLKRRISLIFEFEGDHSTVTCYPTRTEHIQHQDNALPS